MLRAEHNSYHVPKNETHNFKNNKLNNKAYISQLIWVGGFPWGYKFSRGHVLKNLKEKMTFLCVVMKYLDHLVNYENREN